MDTLSSTAPAVAVNYFIRPVGAILLPLTTYAGLSNQRVFSFKFPLNSCLDYSET